MGKKRNGRTGLRLDFPKSGNIAEVGNKNVHQNVPNAKVTQQPVNKQVSSNVSSVSTNQQPVKATGGSTLLSVNVESTTTNFEPEFESMLDRLMSRVVDVVSFDRFIRFLKWV